MPLFYSLIMKEDSDINQEIFILKAPRCNKCDKLEWITLDRCPCGSKYRSSKEQRVQEQKYLMETIESMLPSEKFSIYMESIGYKKGEIRETYKGRRFNF